MHTAAAVVRAGADLRTLPLHARAPQAAHKISAKQGPSKQQHQHKACYRCGSEQHRAGDCRFVKESCHKCGRAGHIQKVCRSKGSASASKARGGAQQTNKPVKTQGANYVSHGEGDTDMDEVMFTLYKVDAIDVPAEEPFIETLTVHGTEMQFERDSGCGVTGMNRSVYKSL